jgi:hypothetical protein
MATIAALVMENDPVAAAEEAREIIDACVAELEEELE